MNKKVRKIEDLQKSGRSPIEARLKKGFSVQDLKTEEAFPVEAFPKPVQDIIRACEKEEGFPPDFFAASILFASSVAIGNTYEAKFTELKRASAVLYIAIIGKQGSNKTEPLKFALKPILKKDSAFFQMYKELEAEYKRVSSLNDKERKAEGIQGKPQQPEPTQFLVQDFTLEVLGSRHSKNLRGMGVFKDELKSWWASFNQYRAGSDEQFWLSSWSGSPISVDRKTAGSYRVNRPFLSVIGGIQPAILEEIASDKRKDTGFLARMLLVYPEDIKKQAWKKGSSLPPEIIDSWHNIIDNLMKDVSLGAISRRTPRERLIAQGVKVQQLQGTSSIASINSYLQALGEEPLSEKETRFTADLIALGVIDEDVLFAEPKVLQFSQEAKAEVYRYQETLADLQNNEKYSAIHGVLAKLEIYLLRFSLLLEVLSSACKEGNPEPKEISLEAVKNAIKLVEYFKGTASKVMNYIQEPDLLESLSFNKKQLYENLPEEFSKSEGEEIAKNYDVKERTFRAFLSDRKFFLRVERGVYQKLL